MYVYRREYERKEFEKKSPNELLVGKRTSGKKYTMDQVNAEKDK